MRLSFQPRSLAGRVALSVTLSAFLSGTVVAFVTSLLADRIVRAQEDGRLSDAAGTLAYELLVKHWEATFAAADEMQELAHTGIVVAIFRDGQYVAGDRSVPFVALGRCVDASKLRACAYPHPAGPHVTVAARDRAYVREERDFTTKIASIAVLLTSVFMTGLALVLAHRAVKPLEALARAVSDVSEHASDTVDLGSHAGVTEVDALRDKLQSTFQRLGRALTQSRDFAGNAAHQLRTPLSTIIGELDLARESAGERAADEIMRAQRVAARLSTLVDRLLILARPDEPLRTVVEVSLQDVVEDALEVLPEASRARIDYRGEPVHLRADPALLVSAIASALENSLKFSSGRVHMSAAVHGEHALLAVEDEGPGVSPHEREQVFEPFYRGRTGHVREIPGHGIGLAVIARVTAVHGGSARFVERPVGARLEMLFACLTPSVADGY
jgi:two-component system OmpR family sensor kinase